MNYNKLILLVLLLALSCQKHQPIERKTILVDDHYDDEEIEELNGSVKEIVIGDSISLNRFNHIYFNSKGDMTRANAKYVSYHDTVYRTVIYQSLYKKAGKKTEMKAFYSVYPDSCGCHGMLKWTFDSKGEVKKCVSDRPGFANEIEYVYDTIGRIKYKDVWGKKASADRYYYKYDSNNRLVQLDGYELGWNDKDPPTTLSTTSFKYLDFDSHNNWIKRIADTDTITRKITYY